MNKAFVLVNNTLYAKMIDIKNTALIYKETFWCSFFRFLSNNKLTGPIPNLTGMNFLNNE